MLANYRDPHYRSVLIVCVLEMVLIGDLLLPLLNFQVLNAADNDYYWMATVANLVPSLPYLASILLSWLANRLSLTGIFAMLGAVALLAAGLLSGMTVGYGWLLMISSMATLSYRIVYFALDRPLTTILLNQAAAFQNDLAVFGTILGLINLQLARWLFIHYGLSAVVAIFLLVHLVLLAHVWALRRVLVPGRASRQLISWQLGWRWWQQLFFSPLAGYCALMGIVSLLFSCTLMTSLAQIHQQVHGVTAYTSLLSASQVINLISLLISRHLQLFNRQPAARSLTLLLLALTVALVILGLSSNWRLFATGYCLFILLMTLFYVQQNTLFFKLLSSRASWQANSPLLNGVFASCLYLAGSSGTVVGNYLMHAGIKLGWLYASLAGLMLLVAVSYCRLLSTMVRG